MAAFVTFLSTVHLVFPIRFVMAYSHSNHNCFLIACVIMYSTSTVY